MSQVWKLIGIELSWWKCIYFIKSTNCMLNIHVYCSMYIVLQLKQYLGKMKRKNTKDKDIIMLGTIFLWYKEFLPSCCKRMKKGLGRGKEVTEDFEILDKARSTVTNRTCQFHARDTFAGCVGERRHILVKVSNDQGDRTQTRLEEPISTEMWTLSFCVLCHLGKEKQEGKIYWWEKQSWQGVKIAWIFTWSHCLTLMVTCDLQSVGLIYFFKWW